MTTINDLFALEYGHSLEFNRLTLSDKADAVNFVSRTTRNNGVSSRVLRIPGIAPAPAGTITVALNGQGGAGVAFLQPSPFYCGFHLMVLTAKFNMTDNEKLWWATCITANKFRFGFGRQANKTLATLDLPLREQIPGWVENTNSDPYAHLTSLIGLSNNVKIETQDWREFLYKDLFVIKKGQRLVKSNLKLGDTPFISAIDSNNGLRQRISAKGIHPAGVITVNYNGNGVAEAYYQPEAFFASDDVNVLYPRFGYDEFIAMFLCTLIRMEKYRFNYGRKWKLERMNEAVIRLPAKQDGSPDWEKMRSTVKSLPFSALLT